MSVVSQCPRRQYMVLLWGHVDLQEYANGSFVSNNNIFTILFLNTYYHKQINKILIAAYNETFRQSSDPVYAHTPMRNVGELRTFNSKLRTSPEAKSINYSCRRIYFEGLLWSTHQYLLWYTRLLQSYSIFLKINTCFHPRTTHDSSGMSLSLYLSYARLILGLTLINWVQA